MSLYAYLIVSILRNLRDCPDRELRDSSGLSANSSRKRALTAPISPGWRLNLAQFIHQVGESGRKLKVRDCPVCQGPQFCSAECTPVSGAAQIFGQTLSEAGFSGFVDGQDCRRWVDSYAVGLFSSAEKTYRNGTTFWDAPPVSARFQKGVLCAILRVIFSFIHRGIPYAPVASLPHAYNRC